MESSAEYATSQLRKLMTILFVERAKRHLRSLANLYGWTAQELTDAEARFIMTRDFVPVFVEFASHESESE